MTPQKALPPVFTFTGTIVSVHGAAIQARLPQASVGDLCSVSTRGGTPIAGQVVAFDNELFSLALFQEPEGIYPGAMVRTRAQQLSIPIGDALLGRVIDPLGQPLDGKSGVPPQERRVISARPPPASGRPAIDRVLSTGIKSIDGFCTIGRGQRLGIFAAAGIGKSSLLGAIARQADADVIIVALVGERGREVQEFVDDTLGNHGLSRSVVVVATSDDSSLLRQTAPYTATTIAEYFRDQGRTVLLIVDSLTRMARAIRETSIAAGDLPVRHGYTNSVYTCLPKLVERAGVAQRGSITALYTVLTNHEDDIDPLADEIKSLLDGHICLRKEIAEMGILPAIDITQSISRLFSKLRPHEYCVAARTVTHALSRLLKDRQVLMLGGTADPELQRILAHQPQLFDILQQPLAQSVSDEETQAGVQELAALLAAR